jgi:hypothetical protein
MHVDWVEGRILPGNKLDKFVASECDRMVESCSAPSVLRFKVRTASE